MARDFDFDFDDEELMRPRRSSNRGGGLEGRQPMQGGGVSRQPRQPQGDRMPGAPARTSSRGKKNDTRSIIILAAEVVVFIILLVVFFVLKNKIVSGDVSSDKAATESSSEAGTNNGVNVDNDNFTLMCTKVQLANDVDGNPAALIYFTFTNKTSNPLSMNEVFPPSVTQAGVSCGTSAVLGEEPAELANKDVQVSDGGSIECCYAISLQDFTSTLTLTIHDNYETFSDIGSTDIPLS